MSLGRRLSTAVLGARKPPRVFLHIGAMKTGTTYLQHLLDDNREQLAAAGILWPGEVWEQQTLAAMDVMAATAGRTPRNPAAVGMWDRIAGQMRGHTGPASVFSMEFLSYADEAQARRIVESFPDHEVHVVITVRDARYSVPAQWQTSCRMAGVVPLRRLIKAMARPVDAPNPGRAAKLLERTQQIPRMLDVWVPQVGAERTHVVTVPPKGSDPTLLWTRFAAVLGIAPETCAPPTSYIHTSLGHESSEFLRLVNVALGPRARDRGVRQVKRVLVRHLLTRAPVETPIRLNRRGARLSGQWNRRAREAVVASGAQVVGDLDDLRVGPPPPEVPAELFEPSVADLLVVAEEARACLEGHRELLLSGGVHADEGADEDLDDDDGGDDTTDDTDDTDDTDADGTDEADDGPVPTPPAHRDRTPAPPVGVEDERLSTAVSEVADLVLECVELLDQAPESTH